MHVQGVRGILEVHLALSSSMRVANVVVVTKKDLIMVLDNYQGSMYVRNKKNQKICNG